MRPKGAGIMPRKQTPRGERKFDELQKGRVSWQPGEDHPMDKLADELVQMRQSIPDQLEQLRATAQRTEQRLRSILEAMQDATDDPTALFTPTDQKASAIIFDRFRNRKHLDHLLMIFRLQRAGRTLGRLQAIQAALDLANGLLEEEEAFSAESLATWRTFLQDREENTSAATTEEPSPEPMPQLSKEELRLQRIDEPLTPIIGSVEQSRQLLRDFEARLPELRRQLASRQGWFEVFSVPKRRFKHEVIAYARALNAYQKKKKPIPPSVEQAVHPEVRRLIQARVETFPPELRDEVYNIVNVGPYVKYRWMEDKQTYTISLGLRDDYPPFPFVPEGF
jgi:hypothetical protein